MSDIGMTSGQLNLKQLVRDNGDETYTPIVRVVSLPAGGSGLTDAELRATPVPVSGELEVAPTQGTYTDRSVASSATSSTQLMAANAARKAFVIQAPLTADIWVNMVGGVAVAGGVGCMRVPMGGALSSQDFVTTAAITYICATAALVFTALEG